MSITLIIADTHVRNLRNGELINRLTADVLHGLRNHHRKGLIGGCTVPLAQSDPADDDDIAWRLEHRKPGTATVTRHDRWTDVALLPGYTVALYRKESVR